MNRSNRKISRSNATKNLNYRQTSVLKLDYSILAANLASYLKLYNKNLGYLINFNVPLLKDGFKRIVHSF